MSTSPSGTSLLPLLAVGVIWYHLSSQGIAMQTTWLILNVIDTFRALRVVRPSGRRIGLNTRKKVMRETLICWIIYVLGQSIGPVVGMLLGWLPFYSLVRNVVCGGFLLSRVATSVHVYANFLSPAISPYEAPIDLTILLFQSLAILILHYLLHVPLSLVWTIATSGRGLLSSAHFGIKLLVSNMFPLSSQPAISLTDQNSTLEAGMTERLVHPPMSPALTPPPSIPGSILLQHPTPKRPSIKGRKSIVFISPPPTPKVLPPSPPSSDSDIIILEPEHIPRTPRRRKTVHCENDEEGGMLGVPVQPFIRKSPRKRKASNPTEEMDLVGLDLTSLSTANAEDRRAGKRRSADELGESVNPRNLAAVTEAATVQNKVQPAALIGVNLRSTQSSKVSRARAVANSSKRRVLSDPTAQRELGEQTGATGKTPSLVEEDASDEIVPLPNPRPSTQAGSKSRLISNKVAIPRSSSSKPTTGGIASEPSTSSSKTRASASKTKSPAKLKPRPRVLKASEGGVAHDKLVTTAASRSRAQAKTGIQRKTSTAMSETVAPDTSRRKVDAEEEVIVEDNRKLGQKRRAVTTVPQSSSGAAVARPAVPRRRGVDVASASASVSAPAPTPRKRARKV